MKRTLEASAFAAVCLLFAQGAFAADPPAPNPPAANPVDTPGAAAPTSPPANGESQAAPPSDPAVPPNPAAAAPPSAAPAPVVTAPAASPAQTEPVEASGGGLFEQSLDGASSAGEAGEGSALNRAFDLNGYVRGDVFVGTQVDTGDPLVHAAYGELAFKLTALKQTYGDAFADVRFRYGLQGERRELFVNLREAYVNLYAGPLDLRLGQQVIVWGRADAFNPTNNLTPIDLRVRSPLEDDRRLGNVGARAFLNFSPIRLEGVWMPLYSPSELPDIPLPQYIAFGEPYFPAPTLDQGLYAGRVHLELPAFEASLSALYGNAPLPGLVIRDYTAGVDPPEIRVARSAYQQQVFGADFSTAIGDVLGVRGEVAYRHPRHHKSLVQAARPDVQYVLGLDRAFGSVNVIAQYIGRYVLDWQRETGSANPIDPLYLVGLEPPLPPSVDAEIRDAVNQELRLRNQILFGQTERVQHLASARVEWLTLKDTLSVSVLGLVNFSTEEWLLYPKLNYKISDSLSTSIGAEIYAGPDGTLFGVVDELLSAGYAELKLAF